MATRFYLPSTGAAAVSPAFGAWDQSAEADRRKMVTTRISSAMTNKSVTVTVLSANTKSLWRQYVSDPIPAQTITGTFKGQLRCSEGDALTNHDRVTILLKVVSNDGSTVRGTLLALNLYGNTNEYSTGPTFTNRKIADGDTLSSVVAQANDRIVLEGGTQNSVLAASFDDLVEAIFGDDSGTDLPEDETTTAANNSWIEFSGDLFTPPPQTLTPSAINGVGATLAGALIVGVIAVNGIGAASDPSSGKHSVSAIAGIGFVETPGAFVVPDSYNPVAATSMAEGVDVFVGRASGNLGDLNDATGTTANAPASWPTGAGTLLLGTQTQVLRDFPAALVISHVVFCARGVLSQDSGYLSNLRVDASGIGGSYPLVVESWPDIRPYVGPSGPYDLARTAKSSPQTLAPDGQPWTWLKLDAGIVTLDCRVDHANITTVGHFAGGYVSEIWFEVYGPQGSKPDPVIIKSRAGSPVRKTFTEVAALVMVLFGQSQVPT